MPMIQYLLKEFPDAVFRTVGPRFESEWTAFFFYLIEPDKA